MPPSLPDGWARAIDPETQLPYYHNVALSVTQWEPPGAPAGSAKVMSALAKKKVDAEYGKEDPAATIRGEAAAVTTMTTAMNHRPHPVVKAGAGAFLQARAASGLGAGSASNPNPQPPRQQQRGAAVVSSAPVRKRDEGEESAAAGGGVAAAGAAGRDGWSELERPEVKRARGGGEREGDVLAAEGRPLNGRPLEHVGTIRVPSPPRVQRGTMEETPPGDGGARAPSSIGPAARPRQATAELPEWRRRALEQDKAKAGEWGIGNRGGTGHGTHPEGANMNAVRDTAAYIEAMTGKSVSVMRVDRKRETHGMQTDGRALF